MGFSVLFFGGLIISLFVLALINPLCGILGYLCVYLVYNPELWWAKAISNILTRPSLVAIIFLICGCAFHLDRIEWKFTIREILFYLFLAVMYLVSLGIGQGMHDEAWMALEKMAKMMVFIFLLIRVVHTPVGVKTVMWGLILSGVIMALQGYLTGEYGGVRLENIGGADFREANALGLFMASGCIFLGFEMIRAPWWGKVLSVPGIAFMMNTMIMTRSRAAFVGIIVAGVYIVFSMPKRFRKQILIYTFLGLILLFSLADTFFVDRMYTIKDDAELINIEDAPLNRWDFWRASIDIFVDHPFGIGVRNYERIVPSYDPRNPGRDAHNTYIICFTEIGIIGIILFLLIAWSALNQLKRTLNKVGTMNLAGGMDLYAIRIFSVLLVYLIGGAMTHTYLYHEILWILLALPICLENALEGMKTRIAEKS